MLSTGALLALGSACTTATAPTAQPAATTAPAAAGAPQAGPGGFAGSGPLKLLVQSHFVPAYDTWFDQWASDWGTKNKVEVQVDHILSAQLAAKIAAEVAAGAGHDIYALTRNGEPALYHDQMVDVGDIAKQVGEAHGGWIPLGETLGLYQGTWHAVPEYFIDFPALYRKDIFDANGLAPVDTWADLLKTGALLKGKGNPIGIAINQQSNDSSNSWTGCLWSFGASTVAQDGKTVALDVPETREMLHYAVDLYNQTMTPEVLSWDDTGNNLLLASGRGSWIQNPISALRTMEHDTPDLAKNVYVSNTPAGPKGRMTPVTGKAWAVANWATSVPAAKAFITDYYSVVGEGVKASQGYNQPVLKDMRKKPMPILGEDPKLTVLQDFDQVARTVGYPGPPTAAAGEVESNWVIPLMVGRAVNDGNVEAAVEWATQKIQSIYAKYT
ncbi:MAG: extracellular solute-binding protein [Chloroflexi bacterium]|nr:extracellular solute-binding protein [Chloroflexota bacterium]